MTLNFDLWTFFVEELFGGFWISVFALALIIFIIMAVLGRMSIFSCIYYELIFFLAMTLGYGYKWITVLIGVLIVGFFFLEIKNYTQG